MKLIDCTNTHAWPTAIRNLDTLKAFTCLLISSIYGMLFFYVSKQLMDLVFADYFQHQRLAPCEGYEVKMGINLER